MGTHDFLERELRETYRRLHKEIAPKWAVHKITPSKTDELVVPTIPFVGRNYSEQPKKILVYASAENLREYCVGEKTDRPWLDNDSFAENRHRNCFDNEALQRQKQADIIPYVHCGPIETGLLLTATMHIAARWNIMDFSITTPREFCECIAFGNYGKYSIETAHQLSKRTGISTKDAKGNIDYAGKIELMEVSHRFIEADIEILRPDYIILPHTMYEAAKKFIDAIKGNAIVVPIYQMLAGNVNVWIAPHKRNKKLYKKYQEDKLHPVVRNAFNGMTTVTPDKYLHVFGYLDEVLDAIKRE